MSSLSRHTASLRFIGMAHDAVMAAVVFLAGHAVLIGIDRTLDLPHLGMQLAVFVVGWSITAFLFSINRGSWRYASIADLFAIVKAAAVWTALFHVGRALVLAGNQLPLTICFLIFVFLISGMSLTRLLYRVYRESILRQVFPEPRGSSKRSEKPRFVLVHTLNDHAELFIRALRTTASGSIAVSGIIDDRPAKLNQQIHGVKVQGPLDELGIILQKLRTRGQTVEEIIVADSAMSPSRLTRVMETAAAHNLRVSRVPDIGLQRELNADQILELKPVKLTDLLGRHEKQIDMTNVARLISGKVVLISGAGGSIGSELVRQVAGFSPRQLILTDNSEFQLYKVTMEIRDRHPALAVTDLIVDVRDKARLDAVMSTCKPDAVFHAAALKHVPIVEDNPLEGIKTNVIGTRNIADAAARHKVGTFVMISTDKAVNPTNIMGATKRAAESYCQALDLQSEDTCFRTVRFGNVLGSNGSVVPRFQEQIARGGPVTVTHPDITRYFMSIPEAVRLVMHASGHGLSAPHLRGSILILDMGKPIRINELARKLIFLAGYKPGIDIEITYTGLRPGEKLSEELVGSGEHAEKVDGAGFSLVTPRAIDYPLIQRSFNDMETACKQQNTERALAILRHLVPEYHSVDENGEERPHSSELPTYRN
ncbi:MAG: polysaccharide biosynthesis protein [Hyphomicrobiaceae bacterium]|nr:polysaccharide biosynthesis protein [Hyphomicrobiaceae bacterium]